MADVLHGVYFLTSQPIPGFEQIPTDSSESPLLKTGPSAGPLPQSYLRHISVCEDTYGIMGANFPALELLALYTAVSVVVGGGDFCSSIQTHGIPWRVIYFSRVSLIQPVTLASFDKPLTLE